MHTIKDRAFDKKTAAKKSASARRKFGSKKIVEAKAKTAKTSARSIAAGLKTQEMATIRVDEVRNKLGLSQIEMSRVTGYSLRSVAGWETGKPLSGPAKQKLVETDRLRTALSQIVSPEKLGEWLRTPNPAFEGQTPIQVIERGESDRLWRMIIQIDSGVAN